MENPTPELTVTYYFFLGRRPEIFFSKLLQRGSGRIARNFFFVTIVTIFFGRRHDRHRTHHHMAFFFVTDRIFFRYRYSVLI